MDYEKIFEEITKLDQTGSELTSLTNTSLELEPVELVEEVEPSPTVEAFLESPMDSPEDLEMKKLMAISAVASGSEESPEQIASEVDAAAVNAKSSYKVSTGELDVIEASEIIIDKGAARLNAFIQSELDMEVAGEFISEAVTMAFPPARRVKPYIKAIIQKAEPAVRKIVEVGIKSVASYAKSTVRKVATGIKEYAKSLLRACN